MVEVENDRLFPLPRLVQNIQSQAGKAWLILLILRGSDNCKTKNVQTIVASVASHFGYALSWAARFAEFCSPLSSVNVLQVWGLARFTAHTTDPWYLL